MILFNVFNRFTNCVPQVDGNDVMPKVNAVLKHMEQFCSQVLVIAKRIIRSIRKLKENILNHLNYPILGDIKSQMRGISVQWGLLISGS